MSSLRKLGIWGSPFHGLVEGGSLTLPNGEVMTYPQPGGAGTPSQDTRLFKVPGTPVVERSPEQAQEDAAKGYQWWNQAIIAAGTLYGRPVEHLYAASDGTVWRITLEGITGTRSPTAPINGTVRFTRFGVIGQGTAEEHTVDVVLSDIGQGSPEVTHYGDPVTQVVVGTYDNAVSPDGSQRVVPIYMPDVLGSRDQVVVPSEFRTPLGFLMLSLGGTAPAFTASLTVLDNRASTLGSRTYNEVDNLSGVPFSVATHTTQTETTGTVPSPPDCAGTTTATTTPANMTVETDPAASAGDGHRIGDYSLSVSVTGRILAYVFGQDGSLLPVTFDLSYQRSAFAPPPTDTSTGQTVAVTSYQEVDGVCEPGIPETTEDTLVLQHERTSTADGSLEYVIRFAGGTSRMTASWEYGWYQYRVDRQPGGGGLSDFDEPTAVSRVLVDGEEHLVDNVQDGPDNTNFGPIAWVESLQVLDWTRNWPGGDVGSGISAPPGIACSHFVRLRDNNRGSAIDGDAHWYPRPQRYSEHLWGSAWQYAFTRDLGGAITPVTEAYRFLDVLMPHGSVSEDVQQASADSQLRGSYNPVTEEHVVRQDGVWV